MLPSKIISAFALFVASVSAVGVHGPAPHRSRAVRHARGARSVQGSVLHAEAEAKRAASIPVPARVRRRGINARRCAAKSSSAIPTSTSAPETEPTTPVQATTSDAPETTPTSTKIRTSTKPATKTSTTEKEAPTDDGGSSGGSGGGSFTGQATFYGTGLGACGITNHDTDMIVAVSHLLFDGFGGYTGGDPNGNPICNKKVTAHYKGKSVTVKIVDRCVGCALHDLDFAPAAFDVLADESLGRLSGMTWSFD